MSFACLTPATSAAAAATTTSQIIRKLHKTFGFEITITAHHHLMCWEYCSI